MRSETPKDRDPSAFDDGTASPEDREHPNSMAMDLLDTPGGDGSNDGFGADGGDGGTMLLPHERKLPISEQRRIVAARKQHEDGVDEDDSMAMGGRRGRGRRRPNADQAHDHGQRRGHGGGRHGEGRGAARAEGDADAGKASGGGNARGRVEKVEDAAAAASGSGSSGGSRVERDAEAAKDTSQPDRKPPATTTRDAVRLDDPAHPHAPLYGAALKAVAELAPAQAAMGPAEQANVAAALTARMAGDAAFAQQMNDPSRLSFGLAQTGDRLFAINHPVPDAPNAVHVSVDLEQARTQSVEASSGHADIAAATRDPTHGQSLEAHAVEAHTREHAPRQA
jgi:hypothetical protein